MARGRQHGFSGWLDVSGPAHIVHGVVEGLGQVMIHYDAFITQLTQVTRLIQHPDTREKLFRTCYSSRLGEALQAEFKGFDAHVQPARWGTVADAVRQVALIEKTLRWGWDAEKYREGKKPQQKKRKPNQEDGYKATELDVVDGAIQSEFFWGMVAIMKFLGDVLNGFFEKIDGCTCHWELIRQFSSDAPPELVAQWHNCPCRGFNGHWFASGDTFDDLSALMDVLSATVESKLPSALSEQERCTLLAEWERGRTHVLSTMILKNQYMTLPPFRALAISHPSKIISYNAWFACVHSPCKHPIVEALQNAEMIAQAARFYSGEVSDDDLSVRRFQEYRGSLRFVWTAEKMVEGEHAKFHKRGLHAPNHSVRYMNFGNRVKELKKMIAKDPFVIQDLAEHVNSNGPLEMLKSLGLGKHPTIEQEGRRVTRASRSRGVLELPYMADKFAQNVMPPPPLSLVDRPVGTR